MPRRRESEGSHLYMAATGTQLQVELPFEAPINTSEYGLTFRDSKKEPYHRWYPYVEGFSAPYVRTVLERFGPVATVLDPFGGAGTTQVETSANGIQVFYAELNPFMRFVADTKVNSSIWCREHIKVVRRCADTFLESLYSSKFQARARNLVLDEYLDAFQGRDYFEETHVRELIAARDLAAESSTHEHIRNVLTLAVASNVVKSSNMTRRADLRRRRADEYKGRVVDVRGFIREKLSEIIEDLLRGHGQRVEATCVCENAKDVGSHTENIDIAITSPPYLNGTNYCRNTKLEQWLLGWLRKESDLRHFRDHAITAGINNVNSKRKVPHRFQPVERVGEALDKTEGDRRIPQLVRSYFSDMFEMFVSVHKALRRGGRFVLDIGDSKFYGVPVPTDVLLVEVAAEAGFKLESSRTLARRYSNDRTELHQVELVFKKVLAKRSKT